MHYVQIIKSDRWSGQSKELKIFLTKEDAMAFCDEFNKDNDFSAGTVPNYYEIARYDERSTEETPERIDMVRRIAKEINCSTEDAHYLLKAFEGHN